VCGNQDRVASNAEIKRNQSISLEKDIQ
jgi:hypothetical protein